MSAVDSLLARRRGDSGDAPGVGATAYAAAMENTGPVRGATDAPAPVASNGGAVKAGTRGQIAAWGLWDWGSSGFNTVIVTFVFSVYLTGTVGKTMTGTSATTWYGISVGIAGLLIAVLAPVTGQQADAAGHRRRSLAIYSALVTISIIGLFWVKDDRSYFFFGAALIGLGSIFFEIAVVFYNSMLRQISTPANIGRVSGFGWSMGYFGGIFLLLFCYFGFISGETGSPTRGFFDVSTANGFNIRVVALVAAAWFALSALPVLFRIPEVSPTQRQRRSIVGAYRELFRDIARLVRTDRDAALFLLASAIFRDGLAGIFHFGAILAASVYGFTAGNVLIFGAAANIVAALGALIAGRFDDRLGPRAVIVVSLIGLLISGGVVMFLSGQAAFWTFGLLLCLFVGPAQSASRTFLARLTPPGNEGQMFGLYATTGRAVSFLSPLLFALFVAVFGADRAGIAGILLVLAVGLALLLKVRRPADRALTSTS